MEGRSFPVALIDGFVSKGTQSALSFTDPPDPGGSIQTRLISSGGKRKTGDSVNRLHVGHDHRGLGTSYFILDLLLSLVSRNG